MKRMYIAISIVCFCLGLLVTGSTTLYAQEKVINLKFATYFPATHKNAISEAGFCKEVEKRTNGRVKITLFPGGILMPSDQTYDSVMKGLADIGSTNPSYTPGRFPFWEIDALPIGASGAYQSTKLANALFEKFKPKEFDGVHMLWFFGCGPKRVCTKEPVTNMANMKGRKIRATGFENPIIEAFGATPVAMGMGDAYDAMSKGVVNGLFIPYEPLEGFKMADVSRYCTSFKSNPISTGFVFMNKNKYDSLPKDIQKTIDTVATEWREKTAVVWQEMDDSALKYFTSKGGKIVTLSPEEDEAWTKAVRPIIDRYVAKVKAMGLPAEEGVKFYHDFVKR